VTPIGSLTGPGKATVEGRIFAVEIRPVDGSNVLATEIADSTGQLTALFYGRSHSPGMDCGDRVQLKGRVSLREGQPVMINPAYELLGPGGPERPAPRRGRGNGGQRRNHRRMPGDQT
jgi:RecG-like helicase